MVRGGSSPECDPVAAGAAAVRCGITRGTYLHPRGPPSDQHRRQTDAGGGVAYVDAAELERTEGKKFECGRIVRLTQEKKGPLHPRR